METPVGVFFTSVLGQNLLGPEASFQIHVDLAYPMLSLWISAQVVGSIAHSWSHLCQSDQRRCLGKEEGKAHKGKMCKNI